jgi:hypothetical protein
LSSAILEVERQPHATADPHAILEVEHHPHVIADPHAILEVEHDPHARADPHARRTPERRESGKREKDVLLLSPEREEV